jgi:hypothetical protein
MDLIDDVDFEPAFRRLIADVFDDPANFVDAPVGGAVDLVDIDGMAGGYFVALIAFIAGFGRGPARTVQRFGQNAGGRRLADPANAAKQISVGDAIRSDRVYENAGDVFLPSNILEP